MHKKVPSGRNPSGRGVGGPQQGKTRPDSEGPTQDSFKPPASDTPRIHGWIVEDADKGPCSVRATGDLWIVRAPVGVETDPPVSVGHPHRVLTFGH